MSITYLDGLRFQRVLMAGIQEVIAARDHLNKINVFPIPDNDTGTNLAFTLTAIQKRIKEGVFNDINQMSQTVANSALDNARGYSGVILSYFLLGFSEIISEKMALTTQIFAQAVNNAKRYAYNSLVNPVEGTVLTVIKEWSNIIQEQSQHISDFKEVLQQGLERARKSLAETPDKLKVLARSGVVDAGGQGFLYFLEGIQNYIRSGSINKNEKTLLEKVSLPVKLVKRTYQYCTECSISGTKINYQGLKKVLMTYGNNVFLSGTKNKAKIHIHTDLPQTIFDICQDQGLVSDKKVDDSSLKSNDIHPHRGSIAILVDSCCDLPEDIIEKLNIFVLPIRLNFGDQHHIDKVSITHREFWEELRINPSHPKTSQPTPGDFRRYYQFLSDHYESVIAIHLTGRKSGTYQSSLVASNFLKNGSIRVIDSRNVSIGLGLIVIRAAEAIKEGKSTAEVLDIVEQTKRNTTLYIALDSLESVVKGGRISRKKQWLANFLRINPILTLDESGEIINSGITWGRKNKIYKFLNHIEKKLPDHNNFRVGIVHADRKETARDIKIKFVKLVGEDNVLLTDLGPGLGVHAGSGAVGIAIQTME
ncbi:MAG: DegV family EDD domain-containing protein [Candidatus Marinimicrobia bacterium]|nr:DegV family EDD domain-containing protein [Candidatus Neomarinimicrobiota bacterium]